MFEREQMTPSFAEGVRVQELIEQTRKQLNEKAFPNNFTEIFMALL